MSSESLTVILAVGLIAGWLAGQIVHGTGYGIINDLVIGVVGSFIGRWLLPQLGVHLGAGIIELCRKIGDGVNQAADLISATASIPSLNFIPLTTFGNWF